MEPKDIRVFLDSGAFSAWNSGKEVDLDEYIAFIRHNIHFIDAYANLDTIAGKRGVKATPAEKEEAAAKSWETYLYLEQEGMKAIPVFHTGEDFRWLHQIIDHGCDYIGLGGMVGITRHQRKDWLDQCFKIINNPDGTPKVKVHGFGLTAVPLVMRYPWYSVDSTSWFRVSGSGGILMPTIDHNGEFNFSRTPITISVSKDHPSIKTLAHSDHLAPSMLDTIKRWAEFCGTDYSLLRDNYEFRSICCVRFFKELAERKNKNLYVGKDGPEKLNLYLVVPAKDIMCCSGLGRAVYACDHTKVLVTFAEGRYRNTPDIIDPHLLNPIPKRSISKE